METRPLKNAARRGVLRVAGRLEDRKIETLKAKRKEKRGGGGCHSLPPVTAGQVPTKLTGSIGVSIEATDTGKGWARPLEANHREVVVASRGLRARRMVKKALELALGGIVAVEPERHVLVHDPVGRRPFEKVEAIGFDEVTENDDVGRNLEPRVLGGSASNHSSAQRIGDSAATVSEARPASVAFAC